MTNLIDLSLVSARKKLLSKEISAVELVDAYIARIEKTQYSNCYITKTLELAKKQAKKSDELIRTKKARNLEGLPVAIKDIYSTKSILTTCASKMLSNYVPVFSSTVSSKLHQDGSVLLGKTNMDEFAMGSTNKNSYYGPVINPLVSSDKPHEELTPGGSSGGSAAAVAGKSAMFALGSDTGGSVREPASFCGITGLKPSYGRCSRWGIISFASSLDQAGILAKDVQDSALTLQSIAGYDPKDSTSADIKVPNYLKYIENNIDRPFVVGIPKTLIEQISANQEILDVFNDTIAELNKNNIKVVDISLDYSKYAISVYYIINPAEASSNLARYDGIRYGHRAEGIRNLQDLYVKTRSEGFGYEVKRRILLGNYILSSENLNALFIKAQKVRTLIINDFQESFKYCDVIFMPTTATVAFPIDKKLSVEKIYGNDRFTVPASIAGLPAISIPAALNKNSLPIGMQLIGKNFKEEELLRIARKFELIYGYKG